MKCPFCDNELEPWTYDERFGTGPEKMRLAMSSTEENREGPFLRAPTPIHHMPIVDLYRCPGCGFLATFETPASQRDVHSS